MNVNIRPALAADVAGIVSLLDTELRGKDWFCPRGIVRRWVTGENTDGWRRRPGRVVLAESGSHIIGVAIASRRSSRLYTLVVGQPWRGKGIGSALLRAVQAREVRVKRDMSTGDPASFYAQHGYRRPSYAAIGRIEVWSQQKELWESLR